MPVRRRKKPPDSHTTALPDLVWSSITIFTVPPTSPLCQSSHAGAVGSITRRSLDCIRDVAPFPVPRAGSPVIWPYFSRSEVWDVLSRHSGRFYCRFSDPYGMGVVDAWVFAGSNEVWSSFALYFRMAWVMGAVSSGDRWYGSFPFFWLFFLIWFFSVLGCTRSGCACCLESVRAINCAALLVVCFCLLWPISIAFVLQYVFAHEPQP